MDAGVLRKLQMTETDILLDVDRFCREHKINYSLYGGTALGAARHAGFIPWDDDLDIVMTRDNFNSFCDEWRRQPPEGYFLQNTDTDITCGINHTKIRKDNTLFVSDGEKAGKRHQGIWIDILVWDKVPERKQKALYIYWNSVKSFIFTRGYTLSSNEEGIRRFLKELLQKIPEKVCRRQMKKINKNIQRYKDLKDGFQWMSLSCMHILTSRQKFPKEIAEHYTEVTFEGHKLMIFREYKKMLELNYGDYMKLPSEKEQICMHNPSVIQFESGE